MNKLSYLIIAATLGFTYPVAAQQNNPLQELMGLGRLMSGTGPASSYLDETVEPFNPISVNSRNATLGFKVIGTIRNNKFRESPFKGIKEIVNKGGIINGCFNSTSIVLDHGNAQDRTKFVPQGLQKLLGIYEKKASIVDVNMTDAGSFLYLIKSKSNSGEDEYAVFGVEMFSQELKNEFLSYNNLKSKPKFRSISANTKGNWAITHNKSCLFPNKGNEIIMGISGDEETKNEVYKATKGLRLGNVLTVSMTNTGLIVCCENGVYLKNVPQKVYNALKTIKFKPYFVKFHDSGHYLITDGKGTAVTSL